MTTAIRYLILSALLCALPAAAQDANPDNCPALLDHQFQRLHDVKSDNFCEAYRGKVLLIVNTASRCGFTPQLEGLEKLYQQYREDGLVVIGFPSNDFFQELKDEEDIASFCLENYGVSFPMYQKSSVRGDSANPLYQELASQTGKSPRWNFYKYLVDRNGQAVAVYSSRTKPSDEELLTQIRTLLDD